MRRPETFETAMPSDAGAPFATAAEPRLRVLIPLLSTFGFLRLAEEDGSEVSGHRAAASASAKAG